MSSIPYLYQLDENSTVIVKDLASMAAAIVNTPPLQETINEITALSGTTAATTSTFLVFGYNVIKNATATNYAARLPNPPKKGMSTTVINTSGFPIVVYPSVTGGSINGVVNGSALVPADGKPYVFFCYENPLPGAWTWTPPANAQYDSGEILFSGLTAATKYSLINNTTLVLNPNNLPVEGAWSYDGKNKPAITLGTISGNLSYGKVANSPQATRIKLYSNFITTYGGVGFNVNIGGTWQFSQSCTTNYYNKSTGIYNDSISGGGSAGTFASISNAVSQGVITGTPSGAVNSCSANIGDAGTPFIICDLSSDFFQGTKIGDNYIGDITIGGIVYEQWVTRMVSFGINTANYTPIGVPQNYKLRFFIEYN